MHLLDLLAEVYQQGLAEFLAQLFEVSHREVNVLVLWAAEGTLEGVDVAVFQLLRQEGSACALLLLQIEEAAVFEREAFEYFAHQEGELLAFARVSGIMAAIDEGILLHGVAMQITKKEHFPYLLNAEYHLLEVEYLRMVYFGRVVPLLVEVVARDVAPVVPVDDSIRVEHGYDLEDEVLPQLLGFVVSGQQKLDDAVTDVAGDRLPWVYSGGDDDIPLLQIMD